MRDVRREFELASTYAREHGREVYEWMDGDGDVVAALEQTVGHPHEVATLRLARVYLPGARAGIRISRQEAQDIAELLLRVAASGENDERETS